MFAENQDIAQEFYLGYGVGQRTLSSFDVYMRVSICLSVWEYLCCVVPAHMHTHQGIIHERC